MYVYIYIYILPIQYRLLCHFYLFQSDTKPHFCLHHLQKSKKQKQSNYNLHIQNIKICD